MRREGYEMIITPPQILTKKCPNTGKQLEPYEEVIVDVDAEYSGTVVNSLTGARKGVLVEMMDDKQGKTRMKFEVPSRGLLGFGPEIATATVRVCIMCLVYSKSTAISRPFSIIETILQFPERHSRNASLLLGRQGVCRRNEHWFGERKACC
jgi:predicted membrane GTPase involved in stress response